MCIKARWKWYKNFLWKNQWEWGSLAVTIDGVDGVLLLAARSRSFIDVTPLGLSPDLWQRLTCGIFSDEGRTTGGCGGFGDVGSVAATDTAAYFSSTFFVSTARSRVSDSLSLIISSICLLRVETKSWRKTKYWSAFVSSIRLFLSANMTEGQRSATLAERFSTLNPFSRNFANSSRSAGLRDVNPGGTVVGTFSPCTSFILVSNSLWQAYSMFGSVRDLPSG